MALIIILEIIIAVVCIAATVTGLCLCWKNDQLPTLYKWGWTFVFLCFTFIGLIVYLIIYPPKKSYADGSGTRSAWGYENPAFSRLSRHNRKKPTIR